MTKDLVRKIWGWLNPKPRVGLIHPWRWRLLTLWIVAACLGWYWTVTSIQDARVSSCKQTYEGVRQVFQPFFPKEGESQTPEQRANLKKFNDTIDNLKANCGKQTKVE